MGGKPIHPQRSVMLPLPEYKILDQLQRLEAKKAGYPIHKKDIVIKLLREHLRELQKSLNTAEGELAHKPPLAQWYLSDPVEIVSKGVMEKAFAEILDHNPTRLPA